ENSDDFATTSEVLLEVINDYKKLGKSFSNGCCIYPTAPFASSDIIVRGLRIMLDSNYDCLFPLVKYNHPVWRGFRLKNSKAEMIWPENKEARTQDMEEVYHDAGQFYWFRSDVIAREKQLIVPNAGSIILPEDAVHDIDNDIDWKIAEMKYSLLNENR
ncbi:MAG: pseudaminic acid cytidylyltransferase, partial [Bacteroidales bacterium]|nr:pseudaminic acid cytidylyltransferase [Bacteroidales bacterium]